MIRVSTMKAATEFSDYDLSQEHCNLYIIRFNVNGTEIGKQQSNSCDRCCLLPTRGATRYLS